METKYEVLVHLKGEVLDPEGRAIKETLKNQGVNGILDVQVAKRYVVTVEATSDEATVHDMAFRYLANPVAQTFTVRKLPS